MQFSLGFHKHSLVVPTSETIASNGVLELIDRTMDGPVVRLDVHFFQGGHVPRAWLSRLGSTEQHTLTEAVNKQNTNPKPLSSSQLDSWKTRMATQPSLASELQVLVKVRASFGGDLPTRCALIYDLQHHPRESLYLLQLQCFHGT